MKLLILFILFVSCSSSAKEWKRKDVARNKRVWRFCNELLDGPGKHRKGMCYISQLCKKKSLGREECKADPFFCAWGNLQCMEKHDIFNKKIR